MAYITTEEVANFRDEIKRSFPSQLGWKFSIKREHSSTIAVVILQSPIQLLKDERLIEGYTGVNLYHLDTQKGLNEFGQEVCKKIGDIISEGWYDKSDAMTDYFNTAFYRDLSVGDWSRKLIVSEKKMNEKYLEGAA